MPDILYEVAGPVARLTLNRPERGNGLTRGLLEELERLIERADLDPEVHVLVLRGAGSGFCGGYDLVEAAETQLPNHDPSEPWDPMLDYAMMSRNVRSFMALQRCTKPVICQVHGFCVAGGTDLALCSDLLVAAEDTKIGYPPARVWGSPTTAMWAYRLGPQRAKRLLFTGDSLTGAQAAEWGLALEAWPAGELEERVEALAGRIARLPANQLQMMKLLCNQWFEAGGLASSQIVGTLLDGIARHTREGYAFQQLAAAEGFREAVRQRDQPFGDFGR
ncbi:MAG TPA: crotonase/enoyl-CoA hydratase family protein [Solirubrobacteraceae bacterium]|nr:crotonase/enoyl-CoA hydratase family protein [Solirubrobacteraceae bacterium]